MTATLLCITGADSSEEDPAIRKEFEETLKREGLPSRMNAEFYERPPNEGEVVMGDVM